MPTLPVGQEDLKSLHSELHPVVDKWYSLGVQLQIPVETLKCIEAEHNQMNRRLLEMLTVWLRRINPSPTWDILTEALESPPVGEKLLAQQLRDKYCPNTESGSTHGYPFQGPTPDVATPQLLTQLPLKIHTLTLTLVCHCNNTMTLSVKYI